MGLLAFFATGQGVLALGIMAALIVLTWDWRVALVSLVVIQLGVAVLLVQIEGVAAQTMLVQTLIIGLSATMVGTSGVQVNLQRSGSQSGGWLFRLLVLILLGTALWSLDISVVLPEFAPAIARIFAWIALIALVMLSLGDNPVFTITALLIWCVLGQALAAVYAPVPEVTVGIGLMELVLGLTASYLLLAERLHPMRQAANFAAIASANDGAGQTAAQEMRVPSTEIRHRTEHGLPGFRPPSPASKDANAAAGASRAATSSTPPAAARNAPSAGATAANSAFQGSEDRERT